MKRLLMVTLALLAAGCGGVQCERAQLALWQDSAAMDHKYRATIRCHKGAEFKDLHVARSATPIKVKTK